MHYSKNQIPTSYIRMWTKKLIKLDDINKSLV